ncbi:MAG: hypothetical protein AMXMBFR56_62320 [Polyangiaceae bacterium]
MIYDHLGAVSTSPWFDSGCGAGPRVRWSSGGKLEIEGEGYSTKTVPEAVKKWSSLIAEKAKKYDLWPSFLGAFMSTESGGVQSAHSYCCYGLMGLLPSTAAWRAGRAVTPDELLNDPALNVDLGANLIAYLLEKYKDNPIKVATAYNAGAAHCTPAKGCSSVNRWGMRSDCPNDKTVDYPGRIIGFNNALVGLAPSSPSSLTPSSSSGGGSLVLGVFAVAAVAATVLSSRSKAA